MAGKHDRHHDHCDHEVNVCSHCDIAYCLSCKKEWGAPCNLNHYPYYWWNHQTITVPATPYYGTTTISAMDIADSVYVANADNAIDTDVAASSAVCSHGVLN